MPTMKLNRRSAGCAPLAGPDEKARLGNAQSVAENLDKYVARTFPERPEIVYYNDEQLYEAQQQYDSGKIGKAAQVQLENFGKWRAAVMRVEASQCGDIALLLACIEMFERSEDMGTADRIRAHVKMQWRCVVPTPIAGNKAWQMRLATRFGQDRRLLPIHMRTMTKPPRRYR